jgi:hypothetical protein
LTKFENEFNGLSKVDDQKKTRLQLFTQTKKKAVHKEHKHAASFFVWIDNQAVTCHRQDSRLSKMYVSPRLYHMEIGGRVKREMTALLLP